MFKLGEKIVYPMHGAGIIEAIEEKEVLGDRKKYYILKLAYGDMKVMIPMENTKLSGLREVIDTNGANKIIAILQEPETEMSGNWNKRFRANMEKLKSGDIYEVAEVVRNLSVRDKEKGLSTGERNMLENARQILVSELVLAKNEQEDYIVAMLESFLINKK